MTPRPVALVSVALVGLLLTGCTSDFLAGGGGTAEPTAFPSPSASADPTGTPTPSAEPTVPPQEYDCDGVVLDRPGHYVLGDCGEVTIEGTGVELIVSSIARLTIRGDDAEVAAGTLGTVEISGQDNEMVATMLAHLVIRGDGNEVDVEETITSANVSGNENEVRAGRGIGSVSDTGLLNEIG